MFWSKPQHPFVDKKQQPEYGCCRHASHFIAAQGMSALASCVRVRSKSVVRFAVTAIELLTRTAGAYACEAALGWVDLPELSEEVILAAQAKAASLGPRMAQRGGQGGSSPGTLAKGEAGTGTATHPLTCMLSRVKEPRFRSINQSTESSPTTDISCKGVLAVRLTQLASNCCIVTAVVHLRKDTLMGQYFSWG